MLLVTVRLWKCLPINEVPPRNHCCIHSYKDPELLMPSQTTTGDPVRCSSGTLVNLTWFEISRGGDRKFTENAWVGYCCKCAIYCSTRLHLERLQKRRLERHSKAKRIVGKPARNHSSKGIVNIQSWRAETRHTSPPQ